MDRHQLHSGDTQFAKVGNLFNQAGVGPPVRGADAGVVAGRESFHMQLVDNQTVRRAPGTSGSRTDVRFTAREYAQRRAAVVPAGARGSIAIERRRKVNRGRERIEQNFFRIEAIAWPVARTIHAIGIVRRAGSAARRHPAMPDAAGLVDARIERPLENRTNRIVGGINQQGDGARAP